MLNTAPGQPDDARRKQEAHDAVLSMRFGQLMRDVSGLIPDIKRLKEIVRMPDTEILAEEKALEEALKKIGL